MANIGYPDTKNKKQSGFSLGSPFFQTGNKKEEKKKKVLTDSEQRLRAAKKAESDAKKLREIDARNKKVGANVNATLGNKDVKAGDSKKKTTPKKKTSYTSAYEKAKKNDPGRYGKMSQEEYTAEAKRQKAHFDKTGKWDYKGEHKTETKTQPTDPTKITSENVTVKSNKEKRKERQAEKKKGRAKKRITKLQNKAAKKGSLTNAQKKRLARNEEKSRGEKVSDENRTKAGKLIGKVGSKIKSKIQETKAKIAEKKKKKEEEKKKKKESPLTSTPELKGKRWKKRSIGDGKIYTKK